MEHKLDENHLKYGGYNRKHVNAIKNKFKWNLKQKIKENKIKVII